MMIQCKKEDSVQAYWLSNVANHFAISTLMTDHAANRQSIFVLMERIATQYGLPTKHMDFLPVYDPSDQGPWRAPLGWLCHFADVESVPA